VGGSAGDAGDAASIKYLRPPPATSLASLCMGGLPKCTPGANDVSAQGGNPMMTGPPLDAGILSCQLVGLNPDAGATAECRLSGNAPDEATCTSASDCAPELGCVLYGNAGTCRTYCCNGPDSCPAQTYCVAENMYEAPQYQIPVCFPVMACRILPDSCPDGLTCTIVRADGTTSCVSVPPDAGAGTEGQYCGQYLPCARGYTCSQLAGSSSQVQGTCLKLCLTQPTVSCPAGQDCSCPAGEICQGGTSPYDMLGPPSVGICVK
jgi:hypothetical protein